MALRDIMMKYGSDKGGDQSTNHNYTTIYDPLLSVLKSKPDVNLFEVGIGTVNKDIPSSMWWLRGYRPGASQRAWSEWLPNAKIMCADVDRDILFKEGNITSFYVDQTSEFSIREMWSQIPEMFDVIIDDGLHTFSAGNSFLMNSHHKLKEDGIYIIEDIPNADCIHHYMKLQEYQKIFKSVEIVHLTHPRNEGDNNILLCRK